MGAAIECFPGAKAILIPRSRFAPVKTTADLLTLASDAYTVTPDFRMELQPSRKGVPPNVKLDGIYKFVDQLNELIPNGAPSLVGCDKLVIEGPVELAKGVVFKGVVTVKNTGTSKKVLKAGTYSDKVVEL
eukprot:scaffold291641_cov35-Tisochrysis_lutea.AAC.1